MKTKHIPVLADESIHYLINKESGVYVDCTLGTGGHFTKISENTNKDAILIGLDADQKAIEYCQKNLDIPQKHFFINTNFKNLKKYCYRHGYLDVSGILMDLGMSSFALDDAKRGFSYDKSGPLDMRFSKDQKTTAAEFINTAEPEELREVLQKYGEVRRPSAIVNGILEHRSSKKIETTTELKQIIARRTPYRLRKKILSQVFQAIRIKINNELEILEKALEQALQLLEPEGRLVVISYHSLEDRIVKHFFKEKAKDCICPPEFPICKCDHQQEVEILTSSPKTPSQEEIDKNPRARSAKLRVIEKL
ncbi:MAG: 16S rRNA (cytosine(1402)-N(4))-methyltransferase RsmH [Candidatus Marinimicrobia bacterium]|nr:16S rRNA (cytosine(1402)-N(4))-methyltransferase RsmH [Candidatus Neomarinimicrobiota bacterium]